VRIISTERDRRGFQPALVEPVVVGDEPLPGDVVLVEAEPLEVGHHHLDKEARTGPQVGGGVAKQATCSSWLVRFMIVLNTR
jgi:hypothetical protein